MAGGSGRRGRRGTGERERDVDLGNLLMENK